MADDPVLAARVRGLLAGTPDVVERRMFGSLGFLVGGVLRIGVGRHADHVMLIRVPRPDEAAAAVERGAGPARMRGRPMRGWLFLRDEAVESDERLERWVRLALAAEA